MDFSQISALVGGLKGAYDLGKAAMGVRDANQLALVIAEMNDKLLDAQQRLFSISSEAWALQQELANSKQECLKFQAALKERGRYVLVKLPSGQFAYEAKIDVTALGEPGHGDAPHYVCQSCFDSGIKGVLTRYVGINGPGPLNCPVCKTKVWDSG